MELNPTKLKEVEAAALQSAAKVEAFNLIGVVVDALWEAGVRDLSAIDGDKAKEIAAALGDDTEYAAAIFRLFIGYTNEIRKSV